MAINPYNQQNPFLESMRSRTGAGKVAAQTQRDVKKVGDLANTQGQARRTAQATALRERGKAIDTSFQENIEDLEFAKEEARKDVTDYRNLLTQQWQKMVDQMNRERKRISDDLYQGQESANQQQRFQAMGDIASAGMQAITTFAPSAIGAIQQRSAQRAIDPLGGAIDRAIQPAAPSVSLSQVAGATTPAPALLDVSQQMAGPVPSLPSVSPQQASQFFNLTPSLASLLQMTNMSNTLPYMGATSTYGTSLGQRSF